MSFLTPFQLTSPALFGGGTSLASFTLPDGTQPSALMDFANGLYYLGASPSTVGAMLTGSPVVSGGALQMPGDNSVQAQAALLAAFAGSGAGATVAAVIKGGNQQVYQFPMTMGANAFMFLAGADSPQTADSYEAAFNTKLVFLPSNFTGPNCFASGYATTTPKRTAAFNDQAGQQDDNGYNAASPVYFGWYTGGSFPFLGQMLRFCVWPKRLTATGLADIRTLAPFQVTPRSSLLFPNTGFVTLPVGALLYERTQPWSAICDVPIENLNAVNGQLLFSNVINAPWCGFEIWIQGSVSGRAAGHVCVRIMHDLNGDAGSPSAIDLYGSVYVADGLDHTIGVTYDGSSLAAGIKIFVDGVQDTSITVAQNNLNASITGNAGQMYIGNQFPGNTYGGALMAFLAISSVERSPTYMAAHGSYDTKPAVDASTALYFDFSEGTGTTLHDQSSNGFNGTISGATWYPA